MKPPIWERQGRPKPPRMSGPGSDKYARRYTRWRVLAYDREVFPDEWMILSPREFCDGVDESPDFPTFAEAIAYADREARR